MSGNSKKAVASKKAVSNRAAPASKKAAAVAVAAAPAAAGSKKKVAAVASKRAAAAVDSRKVVADCRIKLYDEYRKKCKAQGAECAMVKECGKFGIGSDLWPVDQFRMTDEAFAKHKAMYGPNGFRMGKECTSRIMWGDAALRKQLEDVCGGRTPAFLLQPPPGAAPAAAAPAAARPSSKKGGLFA